MTRAITQTRPCWERCGRPFDSQRSRCGLIHGLYVETLGHGLIWSKVSTSFLVHFFYPYPSSWANSSNSPFHLFAHFVPISSPLLRTVNFCFICLKCWHPSTISPMNRPAFPIPSYSQVSSSFAHWISMSTPPPFCRLYGTMPSVHNGRWLFLVSHRLS